VPLAPEFYCGWGREKSVSASLTLTRCRCLVVTFLPEGRHGNPLSSILFVSGETLGPFWSGQQRCVAGDALLEGATWHVVLWGTWSVVGHRRRAHRLWVIIVSLLCHCFHFFSFWVCCCCCPNIFLCFELLYRCSCYINIVG
jgi:hypothetical protein